jgi:hypothetical protein
LGGIGINMKKKRNTVKRQANKNIQNIPDEVNNVRKIDRFSLPFLYNHLIISDFSHHFRQNPNPRFIKLPIGIQEIVSYYQQR